MSASLRAIVRYLEKKYLCHSVILYGSRARGDAGPDSDYDLAGFTDEVKTVWREAKLTRFGFLDIVIYPSSRLRRAQEADLVMRDGVSLLDHREQLPAFFRRLQKLEAAGPVKMREDEEQVRRLWLWKMYHRSGGSDPESKYRRLWLITVLLPNFFELRGQWYWGSKRGLQWLAQNAPATHRLYMKVLANPEDRAPLRRLIEHVAGPRPTWQAR